MSREHQHTRIGGRSGTEILKSGANTVFSFLKNRWSELREILFPRCCPICGRRLSVNEEGLCTTCFASLPFTNFHGANDNPVARLFYPDPAFERANAYFFYHRDTYTRRAVFSLKYHGHPELGILFGRAMAQEILPAGFFNGIDAIVPIPLSKKRERQRGYNQSERLAQGVEQITGLPVWTDVVVRTVDNDTQTNLSHRERYANVEGIFTCINPQKISGRHILLVDDVITTGSTVKSCARALEEKAQIRYSVLALCLSATVSEFPADHFGDEFDI